MTNSNNDNQQNKWNIFKHVELSIRQQHYNFILTKEYQRFEEFSLACLEEKYIGICYGKSGVGKTLSAQHFAQWELYLKYMNPNYTNQFDKEELRLLSQSNTFFYTAPVLAAPKKTRAILVESILTFAYNIQKIRHQLGTKNDSSISDTCKLVIIDRLSVKKLITF